MIIGVDIETYEKKDKYGAYEPVLDARKFICGAIIKETGKKKLFFKKEDLWNYIIELGKKEKKRGKVLSVYAHNHEFDFNGYADFKDKNLKIISSNPFIASYQINGEDYIKFLDTYAIYRMPLKKVGEVIGIKKLEMPSKLDNIYKKSLIDLKEYVFRDAEIALKSVLFLKQKLKEEGIKIKRIYTISQIAVSYFINMMRKEKKYEHLFFNFERGQILWTKYAQDIHQAYRGGRCEVFKVGQTDNVYHIDINNLYGYASTLIRFPNLRTERKIYNPLNIMTTENILSNIGISKVMIENISDEIGLLAVRYKEGDEKFNYYPKKKQVMVGVWTNEEILTALKNGYKLIDIEWSIIWEETINPFREITPKLYELRKSSGNEFDNWFYKQMQNQSYGKLAQTKEGREYILDSVDKAQEYLDKGFKINNRVDYNYLYEKEEKGQTKNYYMPIVPTLINAKARIIMYNELKKIPKDKLIYMDTDSIIMEGDYLNKFKIGGNIGEFKIENESKPIIVYGRKSYAIGKTIKISGVRKKGISFDDFKHGKVKSRKMITIKTSKDINEIGKFIDEERDLIKQMEKFVETENELRDRKVYIDSSVRNINKFMPVLTSIT